MKLKLITLILTILTFSGCTHKWGNFKKYAVDEPANLIKLDKKVKGSDCTVLLGWQSQNIAQATRNALQDYPEYSGLAEVEIGQESYYFYNCIFVEGYPAKEK